MFNNLSRWIVDGWIMCIGSFPWFRSSCGGGFRLHNITYWYMLSAVMDSEDQISLIWVWGHQFVHLCIFDLVLSYPQKDPEMVLRTSRPPFMTPPILQSLLWKAIKTVELLVLSHKNSDCSKWIVYSSACWNQPASNWNPEGKSTFGRLVDRSWTMEKNLLVCRVSKMRHWKMSSIDVCCKLTEQLCIPRTRWF